MTLDQSIKMTMSQYFTKCLYFRKIGVISIRDYTNIFHNGNLQKKLVETERYVLKIFN